MMKVESECLCLINLYSALTIGDSILVEINNASSESWTQVRYMKSNKGVMYTRCCLNEVLNLTNLS